MNFKEKKGKTQRIYDAIKADILSGKLKPGEKLKSLRNLAAEFKVSLRPAQCALETLANEELIEQRRGSGTFVKSMPLQDSDTIYFLVPNASHITSNHETSVVLRRLLYGATQATNAGQLVQLLPVCRTHVPSLRKYPEVIDWAVLERIPPGANVFVSGTWYGPIVPFLIERGIRGVFLATQYECEYPRIWQKIKDASWSILTVDRRVAIRQVVNYLYRIGKRRIVALKNCVNQPKHPFRVGFIDGYESVDLPFNPDFFQEFKPSHTDGDLETIISTLWKKTHFDSLIVCNPNIINTTVNTLRNRLNLSTPDDVALISYKDLPNYMDIEVSISAFDFPWVDIGCEMVNIFNNEERKTLDLRFYASIIDRMNTNGKQHGTESTAMLPELSYTHKEFIEMI